MSSPTRRRSKNQPLEDFFCLSFSSLCVMMMGWMCFDHGQHFPEREKKSPSRWLAGAGSMMEYNWSFFFNRARLLYVCLWWLCVCELTIERYILEYGKFFSFFFFLLYLFLRSTVRPAERNDSKSPSAHLLSLSLLLLFIFFFFFFYPIYIPSR